MLHLFLFFSISWQVAGRLGFQPGNKMDWDTVTAWGSDVLSDRKLTVLPEVTSQTYSMMYLLLLKMYCFRALGKIALNNR